MKYSTIAAADRQLPDDAPARREPLLVLKFGSSVLRGPEDLPAVAGEIYRQRRLGYRVIAVVSALAGETDRLLAEADAVAGSVQCTGIADLVSLGEERTAALLRIACSRIGLKAEICRAEELQLLGTGSALDANFLALHAGPLLRKLEASGTLIVPGFVALGENGERLLLGRGGSDFTATILGGELGADHVRLYKDVDGVFEADPAQDPEARKYATLSYQDAIVRAGKLIHDKAVLFAWDRQLPIVVEALGSNAPTWIGTPSALETPREKPAPLRIALAGYGVVGQAVAVRLRDDPRFEIAAILVRDPALPRQVPPPVPLTCDHDAFSRIEADICVELLSCAETAGEICAAALGRGVDVVTANKQLICRGLHLLEGIGEAHQARLLHAGCVGGGAPLLEAIGRARQDAPIAEVAGILNGTVNFILERLATGESLQNAIATARALGFAEENTEADLSGADAAAKLQIIAALAFDVVPATVEVDAQKLDWTLASRIAASGRRWIQHSSVTREGDRVVGRVRFLPLDETDLPSAAEEWNIAIIRLETGGEIRVEGRGAGGPATAEAVLADLYELLHQRTRTLARPVSPDPVPAPVMQAFRDA